MVKSFSVTQSQIFVTLPICRPNADIFTEISVLVEIVSYYVLIKLSSILSGHICFNIILLQAKTFESYSITSFIWFKDMLVLYSKMKLFHRIRALESKNVHNHRRFCILRWL